MYGARTEHDDPSAEHLEHGGLPGPRVAGKEDELALRDVEGDVLKGGALRIVLENVGEADHGGEDRIGEQGSKAKGSGLSAIGYQLSAVRPEWAI
jgi:hypothetical protein